MAATRGDRGKTVNAGALIARGGCYYGGTGENYGNNDTIVTHGAATRVGPERPCYAELLLHAVIATRRHGENTSSSFQVGKLNPI